MSKAVNIIKGHVKEFTGENDELFAQRYKVCNDCPEIRVKRALGEVCGLCGCRLQAKLRVEAEKCPLRLW